GDEINLIVAGANYGWPVISYGKEYWGPFKVGEGTHKAGMEQPVKYYVPSIAPGSLLRYSGNAFPRWQGNLLAGALKLTHINRIS
ncbi:PQQ-dependent sugar dehydrogenase, partial [Colwellia marinimaniae]